jgi:A-macroglobulin complement component/MG2 domain-containing protein/alpha-2-macroglobulin family protein
MKRRALILGAAIASASCVRPDGATKTATPASDAVLAALEPVRLVSSAATERIDRAIETHYETSATRRSYVMTDKPLYQPGESIWFRVDLRATGTLAAAAPTAMNVALVSPRGAVTAQKRIFAQNGVGQGDFALAAELEGGEYTLQMQADDGTRDAKKLVVSTYEAPRLKKSIEFVRKGYGEGDTVSAAIEVKRATGEPFADKTLTGVITVDDVEVRRIAVKTDKDGQATARFDLPALIARGDGLLTLLVDDGGVTESMQKRIPIVMKTLQLSLFPEGGELVDALPGRVYFRARNTIGKPADVAGRVVDDRGAVVAEFASIHDGLGRFDLTPSADRSYKVQITKPAAITATFDVPAARPGGCVLRSAGGAKLDAVRVAATCSTARTLLVEAVLREKRVGGGSVSVEAGKTALLELPIASSGQGAVRVTLFSAKEEPLAERLVYHGGPPDLRIALTADKKAYSPRDPVKLRVKTTDAAGKPVPADLGLAVVDDAVLSFADDKSARLAAHLYLEPELGITEADPLEEPNYYLSDKPEAPAAMDALLATRGWRKFEWQRVLAPPPPAADGPTDLASAAPIAAPPPVVVAAAAEPRAPAPVPAASAAAKPMRASRTPMAKAAPAQPALAGGHAGFGAMGPVLIARADANVMRQGDDQRMAPHRRMRAFGDMAKEKDEEAAWAPVRVFPVPEYTRGYDGPRTDFRETIYWNPAVRTGKDGTVEVTFFVSDAVTAFRATAEGFSESGSLGGGEAWVTSRMPLSLDAHLPVEVTSGDAIRLPITLTNETDGALDANLSATFGAAFKPLASPGGGSVHLKAGEKTTLSFPLEVVAADGAGDVDVELSTAGLHDSIKKTIRVVPPGFPFEVAASGTVKGGGPGGVQELDIGQPLPGTIRASVSMYPSPVAAMTKGMEGMIREPGGCFEQTSSTNYPNVMILSYLGDNGASDAQLLQKTQGTLDRGYKLLTGYETPNKGYEWFGHTPGHEALTAYGLMEFADMSKVYDVDRTMIERTASWLMSRRDGKGGFLRSTEALDSFGRASAATTDAYVVWALAEAKRTDGLDKEIAQSRALGLSTKDPYLLALAANTSLLIAPGAPETGSMVKSLVALQAKDKSFPGAKETITMSGGDSRVIETTALAALALVKASPNGEYAGQLRDAVDYLNAHRGGYGAWGNTQATILALKALGAYAESSRQMQAAGTATLVVNGNSVGSLAFDKGRRDALVWDDFASALRPGKNQIEVRLDGQATLPYSISVAYRSAHPQSSDKSKVLVHTTIDKSVVKAGEGVKIRAHVENKTADGVPMTLARVGIPGGLVFQTWQLKELRDKGVVDFYETRPREVVLYWRALKPSATKDVELDLLAAVPGAYEAPASSAYLYYTAEDKAWTAPLKVTVEPGR